MSGCAIAALVLLVLFVGGFMLVGLVVVVLVRDAVIAVDTTTPPTTTAAPTVVPTATGTSGIPARTAVNPALFDRSARFDYATMGCVAPKFIPEEARTYYSLYYRGHGTAHYLRGKVALVHLRVMSPSVTWTLGAAADVDRSALLAGHFFEDQAKIYGVSDLDYVPMTWSLTTDFVPPPLVPDSTGKISSKASRDLVAQALRASEASLGLTMDAIATKLQGEGYAEVAFLLHLPVKSIAREFAFPAPLRGNVDVAVVFAHPDLAHLGYTTTHESLHLFGADDIYPITLHDADDQHDIMRDYCVGFGNARIGAMTAYAIGWTKAPPSRPYSIR